LWCSNFRDHIFAINFNKAQLKIAEALQVKILPIFVKNKKQIYSFWNQRKIWGLLIPILAYLKKKILSYCLCGFLSFCNFVISEMNLSIYIKTHFNKLTLGVSSGSKSTWKSLHGKNRLPLLHNSPSTCSYILQSFGNFQNFSTVDIFIKRFYNFYRETLVFTKWSVFVLHKFLLSQSTW
jgi:hypothetical protein